MNEFGYNDIIFYDVDSIHIEDNGGFGEAFTERPRKRDQDYSGFCLQSYKEHFI